jgi:hypothetical protein
MVKDLDLLRKAWPDGHLPIRGLSTVGGYLCFGEVERTTHYRDSFGQWVDVSPSIDGKLVGIGKTSCDDPLQAGHLFPNVNLADVATWACLLQDLALACGAENPRNIEWKKMNMGSKGEMVWCLLWDHPEYIRGQKARQFYIDTDDPEIALVVTRAHVRENAKNAVH